MSSVCDSSSYLKEWITADGIAVHLAAAAAVSEDLDIPHIV
jgi:hypothetical protein